LVTSDVLRVAATRCVDLEIVLPEQSAVLQKLDLAGKFPAAVIVDRQGHVVRRLESVHGVLADDGVERMLRDELDARDEAMYRDMRAAHEEAAAGRKAAGTGL